MWDIFLEWRKEALNSTAPLQTAETLAATSSTTSSPRNSNLEHLQNQESVNWILPRKYHVNKKSLLLLINSVVATKNLSRRRMLQDVIDKAGIKLKIPEIRRW